MFDYTIFSYIITIINLRVDTILLIKHFLIKSMAAAFLPSILVPIVGLVFPALSMALFFIYISIDDIN